MKSGNMTEDRREGGAFLRRERAAHGAEFGIHSHALRLGEFVALNYDELVGRLKRHLGCPDLAADSLHDTWLLLAERGGEYVVTNPGAYVFRMACNVAVDRLRLEKQGRGNGIDFDVEEIADNGPRPEDIVESRAAVRALVDAMESLPRRQRAIFADIRIEGSVQRETAARYGVTIRVVEHELRTAHRRCAQHLHQSGHTTYAIA